MNKKLLLIFFAFCLIWAAPVLAQTPETGDAEALFAEALRYYEGDGVDKDMDKALLLFEKSTEQGFAPGQDNLGFMYETGSGVPRDAALAAEWYRKAGEQGYASGCWHLAMLYREGKGVPQSDRLADEWFDKFHAVKRNEDFHKD